MNVDGVDVPRNRSQQCSFGWRGYRKGDGARPSEAQLQVIDCYGRCAYAPSGHRGHHLTDLLQHPPIETTVSSSAIAIDGDAFRKLREHEADVDTRGFGGLKHNRSAADLQINDAERGLGARGRMCAGLFAL